MESVWVYSRFAACPVEKPPSFRRRYKPWVTNLVGGGQFGLQAELKSETAKRRIDGTDWQKEIISWSESFPAK